MEYGKLLLAYSVLMGAEAASAQALDTTQPLICAATQVVECAAIGDCLRAMPETYNLPVLFKIDIANQVAESARAGGEKRISTIGSVSEGNGVTVLHGTDGADGWSATIDSTSGQMTVVSAHPGISYTVFGTCASL